MIIFAQSFVLHFCVRADAYPFFNFAPKRIKEMEKLIYKNESYAICRLDKGNLYELAEFVVRENYKHHIGVFPPNPSRKKYILFIKKNLIMLIIP